MKAKIDIDDIVAKLGETAKYHDRESSQAMNSLSCGSENWEYRVAHRIADEHAALARACRQAAAVLAKRRKKPSATQAEGGDHA